jgi:hypothetical protein
MKTWYTQPASSFASFYCYNEDSHELVRIRLALNRDATKTDRGTTFASYHRDHYVGFSKEIFGLKDCDAFILEKGSIKVSYGVKMQNEPRVGFRVYDFVSANGVNPDGDVHIGSVVIGKTAARLPLDITHGDLVELAKICFDNQKPIRLTERDASEADLAVAIKKAIGGKQSGLEENSDEEDRSGRATTKSSRRRRGRHRCTII